MILELATQHAKAKLAGEVVLKSYLCPHAAIALNYSVKDIRHDVRQIIIIINNNNIS